MRRRLLPLLALAALVACSDEGPVSGPGTLTGTVLSPNGAEGAAVLILLGDGLGDVTGLGDTEAYSHDGNSVKRIVLVNQAGGDLSFRVAVADTTQPPGFVFQEVAGPDDELRGALEAYGLELGR